MKRVAYRLWKVGLMAFFLLALMLYSVPVVATTAGDINGDGRISIADAILALKICAQIPHGSTVIKEADVNGDGMIGMQEVLYVLRTISEPTLLRVSAPNGGEELIAGSSYTITWNGHPNILTVDILLSADSGATYPYTLVSGTPNDGSYSWRPVPFHDPRKLSPYCRIQVRDSVNPTQMFDESDGVFSLVEAATPMLLSTLHAINESLRQDPYERDSDGDGLYDNLELYLGTDPHHPDSDRDGFMDYYEVFGDVYNIPVPDKDGDGLIAALDNDDDGDGVNDGRKRDSDGDGIPDYLELYGFYYVAGSEHLYYPWNGDITVPYYKTDPTQRSTDGDQYWDSTEITGTNMDLTVKSPGNSPMIPAFPNFLVRMTGYTVTLNSTITETDGTSHEQGSTWDQSVQQSTSSTKETHWELSTNVSASYSAIGMGVEVEVGYSYGESTSETKTSGTARSWGGQMSNATQWSRATSTNPVEAAQIAITFEMRNVGTCMAKDVRITQNLMIGDMNVATLTYPEAPGTIPLLGVNESVTWNYPLMLTLEQLRALRTGVPVTVEVATVAAKVVRKEGSDYIDVNEWGLYFNAAKSVCAHLFLDLGDGNTTEQLVYAGTAAGFQTVTLRDALIWAANGQDSLEGPRVRFYQPGGTLGPPTPLNGWYFSLDEATYDGISSYIQEPDFNLFDTVIKPGSLIVAKAPPVEPTPRIHWGELSPRQGKVTAYVDDYFFRNPNLLEVSFVDKYGATHPMAWDAAKGYYACACPLNNDGTAYVKDGTEKIRARNSMFYNANDPRSPQYETELPASRMSYVPSFEHPYSPVSAFKASAESVRDVFVKGDYAYIANNYDGLVIVDVNPASPGYLTPVGSCPVPYVTPVSRVFVSGNYAYMTDDYGEFHVVDVNPASPGYLTIVGSFYVGGWFSANGIFVSGSLAYVAVGENGLVIVDVSDPAQPVSKGTVDTPGSARDLFVSGDYAYIADGEEGLQIVNITDPKHPVIAGSYDTMAIGVFVSGNLAYISGTDWRQQIVDVTDPQNPVFVGAYSSEDFSYNVFVSWNRAYLAGEAGLQIFDVTNPEDPIPAGSCAVSFGANRLFVSGDYAYLAGGDFGSNLLQVINVNPASPDYLRIPGSIKTDVARDLTVSGNYVYIANSVHGLQIVNVSDPANPTIVGSSYTPGDAHEVFVSGAYAYVAAGTGGLQIVDVTDPANPTIVGSSNAVGDAQGVFISGSYAYVADFTSGLRIVNVSNPANPTIVGSRDGIRDASSVFVSGNYAYVTSKWGVGLNVVDVTNPAAPTIVGSCNTPGEANRVFVSGAYAYVADGSSGLQVVNITNPTTPTIAGSLDTPGWAMDVHVLDGHALVADYTRGLQVINVTNPAKPAIVGSHNTAGTAWATFGVFVSGNHAYMADSFGLQVITFK